MRLVLSVIVALAVAATGACAAPTGLPMVTFPALQSPPTIDGMMDEAVWGSATTIPPPLLASGGRPSLDTTVRVGFNARALYIGARMQTSGGPDHGAAATVRDGAVKADESLAVILDPNNDGTGVMELAVNAAGTEYDAVDAATAPTIAWESATRATADAWVVEIAYYFGDDGAPRPGDIWGFDVRRNMPRIHQHSSMSGRQTSAGARFGWPQLAVEVDTIGSPWYGENTIGARLRNLSDDAQTIKVNARVSGPTRRAHFFDVSKFVLAAGQTRELDIDYMVHRGGRCSLELSFQVIKGDRAVTALRTAEVYFELPALGAALDEALRQISAAYRTWVLLPPKNRPFGDASKLDMLLARWRYLDSRQQSKPSLTADVVMALMNRARTLAQDAVLLRRDLADAAPEG